jgi:methoxymalonate biosynthesis acyl carrier protein
MPDSRTVIRNFVGERIPEIDLTDDDEIFELGLVNSLFAVELVMFIERAFDLSLPNEALTLGNFRNVATIAETVDAQLAETARSA